MGFWTRVRLPSTPLQRTEANPIQGAQLGVFRNVCGIIFDVKFQKDVEDVNSDNVQASFGNIRKWVEKNYGVRVSNGSITQVVMKCEMSSLADEAKVIPDLQTEKEKLVYEAFKKFGLVKS